MVGRNARKRQILAYLLVVEDATARDIAEVCDITIHNARTLLARYHRYGLLTRNTVNHYGTRVYAITTKGVERLDWLRDEGGVRDGDDADLEPWDALEDEELDHYDATDALQEEDSWQHLTFAELQELVRREEAEVRELEAEVHGLTTGDWSAFIRLRLRAHHEDASGDPWFPLLHLVCDELAVSDQARATTRIGRPKPNPPPHDGGDDDPFFMCA